MGFSGNMLNSKITVWRWISLATGLATIVAIATSSVLVAQAATLSEQFETGAKASYAAANVTLSTGVWNLNEALIGGSTSDRYLGTQSARVRNSGRITMQFDRTTGAGVVTIAHAKFGSDANTSWQFWCSTNRGSTWTQIGATIITSSTTLQTATFTPNIAGQVRCEVRKTDGTTNRTNIDNIQIGDYGTTATTLPAGTGPFFDTVNNPVSGLAFPAGTPTDVTPVPPTLSAFDQAVLNLCGAPGKVVTRSEFQTLMANNPATLANIKTRMGVSSAVSDATFLNNLTDIWFNVSGFNHVLCGEPVSGGSIGGLHFAGRYLQLQNQGLAGRLNNNTAREEVVPGAIYTIGAKVIVNGGTSQSTIKGFGYTLNAEDLLALGGYIYTRNPNTTSTNIACRANTNDGGFSFTSIFVARSGGIRTFYPDATPSTADPVCNP